MNHQIEQLGAKRLEAIISYLKSPSDEEDPLPDAYREYLEKLDFADNQIRLERKLIDAARKVAKRYGCGLSTAYKICNETQLVYGSITWYQKEYWRRVLFEEQMKMVERAKTTGDQKGFNMGMKNLIVLLQLDKDPDTGVKAAMLQQHNFQFIINLQGTKEAYSIDFLKLQKLPLAERTKIFQATEAETINFDLVDMIENEENNAVS